jgi:membrane protein
VRLRSALVGATVAGVLWQSAGFAFTAFVAGSGQYRAVYASLAILIIFIIWLYLTWLTLLIGAAIAHYHQHPERVTREPREQSMLLSNRRRERLGLMLARLIGEHYYSGRTPWTAEALARRLQHPLLAVEELLAAYTAHGVLARTRDNPAAYLPACPLETVPLTDIVGVTRATGLERGPVVADSAVDTVMENLNTAAQQALAGRTWRDLVVGETIPGQTNALPVASNTARGK